MGMRIMVKATSDAELAERLNRRRARMLPILGLFFIIQQSAYWSNPPAERVVDHVRMGAWAAMALVILLVVATGGFWRRSAAVRAMINDEQTRANRNAAMSAGFIASMLAGIALYVLQGALQLRWRGDPFDRQCRTDRGADALRHARAARP